jgi:hypothetical protein
MSYLWCYIYVQHNYLENIHFHATLLEGDSSELIVLACLNLITNQRL